MTYDLFGTEPPADTIGKLDKHGLSADTHKVALASALLWTYRTRTDLYSVLPHLGIKNSDGRNFTAEKVKAGLDELRRKKLIEEHPQRPGYIRLADGLRVALYRQLLELKEGRELVALICRFQGYDLRQLRYYTFSNSHSGAVALLRAMFLAGSTREEILPILDLVGQLQNWVSLAFEAVLLPFDAAVFERLDPFWQSELANHAALTFSNLWAGEYLPVVDWATERLQIQPKSLAPGLRMALADVALQRNDRALLQKVLDRLDGSGCDALRAAALIADGQWLAGQQAFELALKRGQSDLGIRKRVFPASIAWLYPLSLLAQGGEKNLQLARK